jgi:hypothetical protein
MATISANEFLGGGKAKVVTPAVVDTKKKPGSNVGSDISNAFNSGIEQIKSGYSQSYNAKNPIQLLEGGLKQGAGLFNAVSAPLAPAFKPIGDVVNYAGDKLSNTNLIKGAAGNETVKSNGTVKYKPNLSADRVLEDINNTNAIAGGVAGSKSIGKGFDFITKKLSESIPKPETNLSAPKVTTTIKVPAIVAEKTPKLMSIFTGESVDAVRSAMEHPDIADLGIHQGDVALRNAAQIGAESSIKARNVFQDAHQQAFKSLVGDNKNIKLSRQKLLYQFVDDLKKNDVDIKNGKANFATSKINTNPGEVAKIKSAYQAIQNWKDWSLEGTVKLKQILGQYTKFAREEGGSSKSPFLGKFYNYLDNQIASSLPKESRAKYLEMNKKYSDTIGLYDDMVEAFNSGDPFTKLAQIFGSNKDTLRQVVDFYEKTTGNQVKPIVAGRLLAEEKPASFGFLNPRQWIDFFISPKVQAGLVTKTGKLMK